MLMATLFTSALLASTLTVDGNLPAGNIVVERIEGDTVLLHQDLRDTDEDWIYWKFRVTGAAGRMLHFTFTKSYAVGSRSAAVSTDRGKTWSWGDDLQPEKRREAKTNDHPDWKAFQWAFGPNDDEVWFCQTIPYDAADWRAFLDRHAADRGRLFEEGVLCKSRKGRSVEYARFGRLDGQAACRIFVSSRHHCAETTATFVLEGLLEQVFADDELGAWLRANVEFRVVPFVDKDGVVDGDQGKRRKPHDHARDYSDTRPVLYPEVRAIMAMLREWKPTVVNDFHCPWLRGSWFEENNANEFIYQVGIGAAGAWEKQQSFGRTVERMQEAGIGYRQADDFKPGQGWNSAANWTQGMPLIHWAAGVFTNAALVTTFEIPFANQRFKTLHPADFRAFGRDVALAYRKTLIGCHAAQPSVARQPKAAPERGVPCGAAASVGGHVFSMSCKVNSLNGAFATPEGRTKAVRYFRRNHITKLWLESYRHTECVSVERLKEVRDAFRAEGFETCGMVTPTQLNTNRQMVCCWTDPYARQRLREEVEKAVSVFDCVIMDDFLFTSCECPRCQEAKKASGAKDWGEFRCNLLSDVCEKDVVRAAKVANPKARVIIKYPCWYKDYGQKGYDPVRETALFGECWIGTETRDANPNPLQACWIVDWMDRLTEGRCGGGWYDPLDSTPEKFVEQARYTILGGARESLIHCYDYLAADDPGTTPFGEKTGGGHACAAAYEREADGLAKLAALLQGTERGHFEMMTNCVSRHCFAQGTRRLEAYQNTSDAPQTVDGTGERLLALPDAAAWKDGRLAPHGFVLFRRPENERLTIEK